MKFRKGDRVKVISPESVYRGRITKVDRVFNCPTDYPYSLTFDKSQMSFREDELELVK